MGITFAYPYLLAVMSLALGVFAFLILTNKAVVERIFRPEVLERLRVESETIPGRVRKALLLVSAFLMIVALARPIKELGKEQVALKRIDVITALDISTSMRTKDVFPNRLEFAKKKLQHLIEALPNGRIGIVAFARYAFVVAPFSDDTAVLKMMLDNLDSGYISEGATDFHALIDLIEELYGDKEQKVLVLFTDGGDPEALEGLQERFKQSNISVFGVLVGTPRGAPVLDEAGRPLRYQGKIAITKRNDALGKMIEEAGGAYVIASPGDEEIDALAQEIMRRFEAKAQGKREVQKQKEYFYYPLGLSLLILLIALSSLPRRKR